MVYFLHNGGEELEIPSLNHQEYPEATNYVYIFYDGYNVFKMSNTEYLEYSYDPELDVETNDVWYDELVYEGTLLTDVEMEEYKELLK